MQSNQTELGVTSPEQLLEHKSRTLSVNAKVPRATVPPQKYSSPCTSCFLTACVPHEACTARTVKVRNEPVPRGNPASLNLLSSVRCPQYLVSCHQIQSQSDVQQFIFILITHDEILLDVWLVSLSTQSDRRCKHGKVQIYPHLKY
ncbi:hypothetical protein M9H77_02470 [Catharanthus roseus]|uniref:Uncharacterized protein n=1 Tax=Catharanthus roseus TaxID=4058 RepID=A0ACC0C8W0_CATRO|nr:hypothetical protein M9H77_02470 [Catharanthus roseus]